MAFITPATGQAITFGKVNKAFTNNYPNTGGNAPSGGKNIKLSAVLGTFVSISTGTQIRFSQQLGGRPTPYDYDT